MSVSRVMSAAVAALGFVLSTADHASAQVIIEAGPRCVSAAAGGLCFNYLHDVPLVGTVESIVFDAPTSGTAAVTVNGSLQCYVRSPEVGEDRGVIDIGAQIVKGDAEPEAGAPGGQRIAMRLPPSHIDASNTVYFSNAFNLTNTRIVNVSKGKTKFRYKIYRIRMDEGTYCSIYNVGLHVIFSPK